MKVAIIGRTKFLLESARYLLKHGHSMPLVWTCPGEAYYGVDGDDFESLAKAAGAIFIKDTRINNPDNIAFIKDTGCDAAVSVNWPTIISEGVIRSFPKGILNAHAGDLPRYRGNATVNWAILMGEPFVGVCIHYMIPELDAGNVLVRRHIPLEADTYIGEVYDRMAELIPEMFLAAVDGLEHGMTAEEPQSTRPSDILHCYPRRKEDGRIDWSGPVEKIYRLIRASSRPFSGAYSFFEGRLKATVWRAQPVSSRWKFLAVPGQVCHRLEGDPVVACGDGMLRLTDIAVEGAENTEEAKHIVCRSTRSRLL